MLRGGGGEPREVTEDRSSLRWLKVRPRKYYYVARAAVKIFDQNLSALLLRLWRDWNRWYWD